MKSFVKATLFAVVGFSPLLSQAQSVMTRSALAAAPTCPQLVFISDVGRQGLFFPDASVSSANQGTTLKCAGSGSVQNVYYKRVFESTINAKWFGLSESISDNRGAVDNAIAALQDGQELLLPEGSYRFDGPIILPPNKRIRLTARGTLIFGNHDGIIVQGKQVVDVKHLTGLAYPTVPGASTPTSGILIRDAAHSEVKVGMVEGFFNGISVVGSGINDDAGSQYNKVEFSLLLNNARGVNLSADGIGWVNENTFHGGRIFGEIGLYARRGNPSGDFFNGNKFYNFGFEGLDTGVDVDHFYNNIIMAPRFEQVQKGFKFGAGGFENVIVSTALYESDFVSNDSAGNAGKRNLIIGKLMQAGGVRTGAIGLSDDSGRILGLIRDPNTAASTVRKLPLSSLPGVTP